MKGFEFHNLIYDLDAKDTFNQKKLAQRARELLPEGKKEVPCEATIEYKQGIICHQGFADYVTPDRIIDIKRTKQLDKYTMKKWLITGWIYMQALKRPLSYLIAEDDNVYLMNYPESDPKEHIESNLENGLWIAGISPQTV